MCSEQGALLDLLNGAPGNTLAGIIRQNAQGALDDTPLRNACSPIYRLRRTTPLSTPPRHGPKPPPGRLLSTDEAAAYLSVSRRKLEDWVASGFCPVVRLDGTVRRFDRDALDVLIDSCARSKTKAA